MDNWGNSDWLRAIANFSPIAAIGAGIRQYFRHEKNPVAGIVAFFVSFALAVTSGHTARSAGIAEVYIEPLVAVVALVGIEIVRIAFVFLADISKDPKGFLITLWKTITGRGGKS